MEIAEQMASGARDKDELLALLTSGAISAFGKKRAEALAPMLSRTAEALVKIAGSLPNQEEEPAFWE